MAAASQSTIQIASAWEQRPISTSNFDTQFIGSFFETSQLPTDARPQIAVAGRSNVGKSSLLNKILGHKKLAKVSSTPGKTRALNFFDIDNRFYIVDLPGYGYARVARSVKNSWSKLVMEYLAGSRDLVGLLLLLDCRRDPSDGDIRMINWLAEKKIPVLLVMTKTDKLKRGPVNQKISELESRFGASVIPFSVISGQGKQELIGAVRDLIQSNENKGKASNG